MRRALQGRRRLFLVGLPSARTVSPCPGLRAPESLEKMTGDGVTPGAREALPAAVSVVTERKRQRFGTGGRSSFRKTAGVRGKGEGTITGL